MYPLAVYHISMRAVSLTLYFGLISQFGGMNCRHHSPFPTAHIDSARCHARRAPLLDVVRAQRSNLTGLSPGIRSFSSVFGGRRAIRLVARGAETRIVRFGFALFFIIFTRNTYITDKTSSRQLSESHLRKAGVLGSVYFSGRPSCSSTSLLLTASYVGNSL
jgi:hypothetical protein